MTCFTVAVCFVDAKKHKADVDPPEHTFLSDALAAYAKVETPYLALPVIVGAILLVFASAYVVFGGANLSAPPPEAVKSVPAAARAAAPPPRSDAANEV